jgi:hypothetical protein
MRRLALPLLAAALAWSPGGPVAAADSSAAAELEAARALWRIHGTDDYRFRIRRYCFCFGPYVKPTTVVVRNQRPVRFRKQYRAVNSIPKLFGEAEEALGDDRSDVRYSSRYGFPTLIDRDPSFRIADEEVLYRVRRFRELD